MYEKLTEILEYENDHQEGKKMLSDCVENTRRSGELKRQKKRERFGNLAKHVLQALADMEKPDEEEEENEEGEDDDVQDDGEDDEVDAFMTSALSDDYDESDVETSDSDDAEERDGAVAGIAESDEDEDDDDDDDLDEDEARKKKYSMLVVLANMDGDDDDNADINVQSEKHKEHRIDQGVFAGFRGVETQLKRENIRAHCLRLATNYYVSNDDDNDDVREYVALFRERFGGCAARADAVTSAIASVPSCWLLNDFLPSDTFANKSDPSPSMTKKETKTMRTAEIFVQCGDGREVSLSTASSSFQNSNTGVKQIIIKACLDRNAVCLSSLDYAKTTILHVNDGNGEGLLLALGVKNAYAACELIADSNAEYGDVEQDGEQRIVAVLKPLTRTSFSLTPALADESEIFREITVSEEGERNVREEQHQQYHYSSEHLRDAFSLLSGGIFKTKRLRACEDVSRLFQLTIGGSERISPTTHTATTTTTTTTTTTSLTKYCEEDEPSLNIPSSQRTTSTTFEEAKEHFDDVVMEEGDYDSKGKDETANYGREEDTTGEYYSSAFAALTTRITPRDASASMPIVERLEKWYGDEMDGKKRSFTSSGTGSAATATAGMRLLASISRSAKKIRGVPLLNGATSSLLHALDACFENEFISTTKRSSDAGFDGMVDYEDPRSPEKFTRVRDQSNAFDLPKSPPLSAMKRKKRTVGTPNGGRGLLSPARQGRKKRQQTAAVNFEDEDDVVFSPKKTFKSPRQKVAKSTNTTPVEKKKDTKIELWTVGPEPDCFTAAKGTYDQFIETKCAKSNDERDPDLGAFSRNIVKRLAVSLAKRRCVVDQASNSKAWGEILRETKETLCLDRKELKSKFSAGSMKLQENKGLKRREYLIQIHLKLTLHAMRSIKGDEIPFIANMKPVTNSASGAKKTSRKQQEIQEDSASAKETAKAVTKLVKEIFFLLGLEEGTKTLLESDVEPYYGKFCPECIGMIAHDLNVSTKLTSRYQLVVGKNNLNVNEDKSAAAKKSSLVPFSPPPAAKNKKTLTQHQQTVGLRRSPRKLGGGGGGGGGQTKLNSSTALALSHHYQKAQPSTSSASSAFQQQARKKVLNSVRSNQTRVIEHKPLSPRTKAAQQKREQLRRQNEASRLQTSNRHGASNRNVYMHTNAMMGGLNTVSKNRFAKNTNGTVIGASRNGGIKPRQLTHAFSQQPLQTPLPPSKNGGIARGDRFAVQSTPLTSHFGGGIDGTPSRVPDTYNTIAVVESTPMQTSGGRGGGGGGGAVGSRRTNNNESFTIEQTPLQSNRRPKFTPASGSGRRKRELEEVVAETPPTKNATATRSGRLVQAALDNNINTASIKNKK